VDKPSLILNVIHSHFFPTCLLRLLSSGTEQIFNRLKKIDWTFCSYSSTAQYFCPVHTELEFYLTFSVVFSSANAQSAALANPRRRLRSVWTQPIFNPTKLRRYPLSVALNGVRLSSSPYRPHVCSAVHPLVQWLLELSLVISTLWRSLMWRRHDLFTEVTFIMDQCYN